VYGVCLLPDPSILLLLPSNLHSLCHFLTHHVQHSHTAPCFTCPPSELRVLVLMRSQLFASPGTPTDEPTDLSVGGHPTVTDDPTYIPRQDCRNDWNTVNMLHLTDWRYNLNLSSINLVSIFRCSSPPRNPVYVRCVDPSVLPFSHVTVRQLECVDVTHQHTRDQTVINVNCLTTKSTDGLINSWLISKNP
jgi:hypothetical protein